MATVRAHIVLPEKLAREIEEFAGPRGRSAFLVELAEKELKRRRLIALLEREEPAWKDENHPDLVKMGAAEWVRALRHEPSVRLQGRDENLDPL